MESPRTSVVWKAGDRKRPRDEIDQAAADNAGRNAPSEQAVPATNLPLLCRQAPARGQRHLRLPANNNQNHRDAERRVPNPNAIEPIIAVDHRPSHWHIDAMVRTPSYSMHTDLLLKRVHDVAVGNAANGGRPPKRCRIDVSFNGNGRLQGLIMMRSWDE